MSKRTAQDHYFEANRFYWAVIGFDESLPICLSAWRVDYALANQLVDIRQRAQVVDARLVQRMDAELVSTTTQTKRSLVIRWFHSPLNDESQLVAAPANQVVVQYR